ncbi:nucleotidyltransferase domain-containing protein [Chthonobacter rhizosphaerae]|uniref:nucleotidyltransferase domain-containing protein n=1 Tax=Chthonobacter rhizosphaerae TaxID=2735553 RepID=UPI001AEEB8AA|nr:nucleotidyltransferase domain-containing protein [Chthonobacter rhizosphaerae]
MSRTATYDLTRLAQPPSDAAASDALGRVADALVERYGPTLVETVLFGSRARGDHRPESDADVAVVLAGGPWEPWQEKIALLPLTEEILDRWGLYVQFWIVSAEDWRDPDGASAPSLVRAIRRDARPLRAP